MENKICLVTGSARGIGKAVAEVFHKEGATVLVTDIRDQEGREVAQSLGDRSEYFNLDVREESAWESACQHISNAYGRLDILVNNAGITGFLETSGPFDPEHADLASWEEVHRVNATGVMLGCKYGIRLMKEAGGSIVNISSRSGLVGIPGAAAMLPARLPSATTQKPWRSIAPRKTTGSAAIASIRQLS